MALFAVTSAAGAAASIISEEAAWNDVTDQNDQEIEMDETFLSDLERRLQATAQPTDELTNDPFDAADDGVQNTIVVTIDFKESDVPGPCPTSTDGKAAILAQGNTACSTTSTSLTGTADGLECDAEVKNYKCEEEGEARRLSGGRKLAITHTITAVVELTIETYCTTGDTAAECDPDSVEALNDQVEAAVKAAIAADADLTFDELVADLVDDLKSWYPAWSGSKSECKNDGKYPNYSKFFLFVWYIVLGGFLDTLLLTLPPSSLRPHYPTPVKNGILKSTLKACCQAYYGWEEDVCISNSGGSTAELETGKYYIDWDNVKGNGEGYCVRACLKEDSALNPPLVNCGGLNERWETPYDTAEKCCEVMKTYVNQEYCLVKSEGGEDAVFNPTGSGEWYVKGNDCVKDCTTSDSECEALDLADNWTTTYDDKDDCCKLLTWLTDDDGNCPAQADYGDDDDDA